MDAGHPVPLWSRCVTGASGVRNGGRESRPGAPFASIGVQREEQAQPGARCAGMISPRCPTCVLVVGAADKNTQRQRMTRPLPGSSCSRWVVAAVRTMVCSQRVSRGVGYAQLPESSACSAIRRRDHSPTAGWGVDSQTIGCPLWMVRKTRTLPPGLRAVVDAKRRDSAAENALSPRSPLWPCVRASALSLACRRVKCGAGHGYKNSADHCKHFSPPSRF